MVFACQLKAQVIGQVADALEGSVDVEEPHGRVVKVLGLKDEREAKLGAAHHHAALAQQPGQRGQDRGAHNGHDDEGNDELCHGSSKARRETVFLVF